MSVTGPAMWKRLEEAVRENPYVDEYDDEMTGYE